MIPYRDANPSKRLPIVTVALIVINAVVFFYELSLGDRLPDILSIYGVIPRKWFMLHESGSSRLVELLPYFTSMFFHGGWFHVIGNMWYLWIFGDNIEDLLGHFRFLVFYIACGIIAGLVHTYFNSKSTVPALGASGAIAGVLGAYLISFPRARVLTLIPFFYYYETIELPAVIVLGGWFVMQFLSGTASIAVTSESAGGVAWWAHIGGFIAGMLLLFVFLPSQKRYTKRN